ncbi:HTH-type transcriptional regulator CysB [Salinisphaera sp. USBA-960]|uniref:HTH-type transcriptional regulator CysB n=1 Tax=Salinisphaera orenii TaxID=856731 RepID=UPI000DBE4B71|nr:HTH-type transcriptional regulator CysB [Salifodinibacter halophilus]NNC25847.1 HTH-type transcriptional regulator CysB [Salifodinibacter halophilus]
MKLRQLLYIHTVAEQDLNITAAANKLHTSQPGVSKQIRLLEAELGVQIFERNGKHLGRITPAGSRILDIGRRILTEVDNLGRTANEFTDADAGNLTIATTHTQARYALPPTIAAFRRAYPRVALHLDQGAPPQIASWAASGQADFAIATEALENFDDLILLPCYTWNRAVLVRQDHPLATVETLSLADIAAYPIITYTFGFTGRSQLDRAFEGAGETPDVVLTAVDADVIKTYVRQDLGIGVVASMAYEAENDTDLVRLDASHLFAPSTTCIAFRHNLFLTGFMRSFIRTFAPQIDNAELDRAQASFPGPRYQSLVRELSADLPMR